MSVNLEIAKSIRIIESLKADILSSLGEIYRGSALGEDVGEAIAGAIANMYLLAGRLGISYTLVDIKMQKLLKTEKEKSDLEHDYGDLTALERHLTASRGKNKLH